MLRCYFCGHDDVGLAAQKEAVTFWICWYSVGGKKATLFHSCAYIWACQGPFSTKAWLERYFLALIPLISSNTI